MDDLPGLPFIPNPTASRPLLGLTVLVVEDSLYACDALRLMCLHSGARIRRADCLRSAERHLQAYRPSVVIIDLGLPDGSGTELIAELSCATPRIMSIIATSATDGAEARAMAAGADGFLDKPLNSLGAFQKTILATLPGNHQPNGLRVVSNEKVQPDPLAFHDDMMHASNLLEEHADRDVLDYVAQFLGGVARAADDTQLAQAADALIAPHQSRAALDAQFVQISNLVQDRLANRMAI